MASPTRPLLISSAASRQAFVARPARGGGASNPRKARQTERLAPRFAELQQARGTLQADASGAVLEQVLVLETNGPVKDLYDSIMRTPGLEWLANEDLRDLPPDEDFFIRKSPDKRLSAQLYLILFNQQALDQLLSLWRLWCANKRLAKEHRHWPAVFRQLRDIRRWSVRDRLEETGVIEYWRERVAAGFETVSVEIEMWFRPGARRLRGEDRVRELVARAGGQVLASCAIPEIAYHALACKLRIDAVEQMLENPEVELLQCDEIRFVRPSAQAGAPVFAEDSDHEDEGAGRADELGDPLVALLDGLPLENHQRLAGRLIVDDPDGWAETYPVASRCHGTAMASLILHGDLSAGDRPAQRRLYVRPILRPDSFRGRHELAPDDVPWVDLVHRAVRRIAVGEGSLPPAARSVRVVNLSVGDPFQPFIRSISPLARLLDWLSWRHGILFIVSAGNHTSPLVIEEFQDRVKPEALILALADAQRHRRILSPAEAVNVLSVGATAEDASGAAPPQAANQFEVDLPAGLPSPISGLGRGYRRAVKPDVLAPGGRVVFAAARTEDGASLKPADRRPRDPPGQRVAAPSPTPGDLRATRFSSGTSNAAALVSRAATHIADALMELRGEPRAEQLDRVPLALWLRTLVVHGASWSPEGSQFVTDVLRTADNRHTFTDEASAFLTFGKVRADRVLACTAERVTVLAAGNIAVDERYVHRLPLPPSLNAHTAWRRLTITLSWFSPINPRHRKYRRAALWFDPPGKADLLVKRTGVDWRAVRRGTLQHEVLEGEGEVINVGEDAFLEVPVSCTADAGDLEERIPYAMAISLEVAPGVNTRIYDEVRARIVPRVPVRPGA